MQSAAVHFSATEDCEIPDAPLAQVDELEMVEGSFSAFSSSLTDISTGNCEKSQSDGGPGEDLSNCSVNLSSSLQDLVESFDDKVAVVLKDFEKDAEKIAPIKIRSQEEIMSESQFWWTLTGNYGNLPPIDFDRSQIRRKQLEALNFNSPKEGTPTDRSVVSDCDSSEDTERIDFHRLATAQTHNENGESLPFNADKVIEEIDEILQAGDLMNQSLATNRTIESVDSMYSSMRSPNVYSDIEAEFKSKEREGISVSIEEMNSFTQSKLITIVSEMEQIIQLYNEELVRELARKDEFEYEKEMRNKFITLLVAVQERRRKQNGGGGKKQQQNKGTTTEPNNTNNNNNNLVSVSIPFDDSTDGPSLSALEWLVKILQAMIDDSVHLPSLLTDYILNVVCPSKFATD
ncbi:hypothetical protein niasHT_027978 [Heterodera trifolii]|uniref:Fasciculation and elongation protein zeta-2 n=1 Tax=Heterodera trifolii TaxID=157864 RepID=A0ABD2KE54_9BILA